MVHAEGIVAERRGKRYAQDALVALVRTIARPRARPRTSASRRKGRSRCCRMAGRYALVWSCGPSARAELAAAPTSDASCERSPKPPATRRHPGRG